MEITPRCSDQVISPFEKGGGISCVIIIVYYYRVVVVVVVVREGVYRFTL